MKSFLLAVGCTIVAWVAVHYFMRMQPPETSSVTLVAEVMVNPGRNSENARLVQSEPNAPSANNSTAPKSNPTERKAPAKPPNTKRVTSTKTMYFKPVVNRDGSLSRVTIYNTQIGNVTILLLDASARNGLVYIRRGVKDKHLWEVKMSEREISVFWDDKRVPPG